MTYSRIYKWSVLYELLRFYVRIAHRLFYSSVVVRGKENIPAGIPVIFAPNHQNALMDPLAIVCNVREQVVFLARADIFSNKLARLFLSFLKIMPVYRMRDGIDKIDNNKEIFNICVEVLKHNGKLCLMPEGTQNDKHQLRPLVKGMFRIALQAAEFQGVSPVIIPVGIDYSDYSSYRSQLIIQFGKPIYVNEFKETYSTNPALALNLLKDRVSEEIKKLMLNIECGEYYEAIDKFRHLYRPIIKREIKLTKNKALNRYNADKFLAEKCNSIYRENPSSLDKIKTVTDDLTKTLEINKLSPNYIMKEKLNTGIIIKSFLCLIGFPIIMISFLINAWVLYLPFIINKKVSDKQFHSSIKFAITVLTFPMYYAFLSVLIFVVIESLFYTLIFIIAIVVLSFLSIYIYSETNRFIGYFRAYVYKNEIKIIETRLKFVDL